MVHLNTKISKILVISLIALILSNFCIFFLIRPGHSQPSVQRNLLIVTKGSDSLFLQGYNIDKDNFNISTVLDTDSLITIGSWIDSVLIFDADLSLLSQNTILDFVENGGSAIIYMGQNLYQNATLLDTLDIIDIGTYESSKDTNNESMLFVVRNVNHPISTNIDWNSAPDIKLNNMTIIPLASLNSTVERIIDLYPVSRNLQIDLYRTPAILEKEKGDGDIIVFTGWLEDGANLDFKVWPYYNYLLYALTFESLGLSFDTYPLWPYSPVPHLFDQIIIGIIVVILAILAVALFVVVKRKSSAGMDQKIIETLKRQAEEEKLRVEKESLSLEKRLEDHVNVEDEWEAIGVHRQLGGFLFTLFLGLFLVLPQLLVANFLMPQIIQPYPQAAGWYNYAYNFFQIIWILFDFGTSFALAKYFAEHRVNNPEKSIHYIQIYVWWQIFTGIVQISIVAFIGSIIFPFTPIAHMSWIFIAYSFIQYPGIFLVFMYTFQGMQRSDLHLISYVAWEVIWLLVGQVIFTYLGRLWGAANPVIGEALGAGIGYAIARCFDFWVTFIMTFIMFKKLGFSPKSCFRIDFSKEEFKETLRYGSKLAIGEGFVQLGWFLQVIITSIFVANYSNNLGWFNLAFTLGQIVQIVNLYGNSLLGAFSESSAHNKKTLTKLYVYQAFRWGNYFAYFLISVLFAVGAKFLVGAAGEDYGGPAVQFLVPLLLFHTGGIYSWLVDAVFEGTGHTGYAMAVWIIEQTTRALLMFLFVIIFRNMVAVIIAYIPAVFTKDIIAWIIVKKKIVNYQIHPFKSFIVPGISAIINFIVLYFVAEVMWGLPLGDKIINTALIFLLGIFIFMYFYAFIDGFLGGYDINTIKELERAAALVKTPFIRFFPRFLYKIAYLGTKISPFHKKFPIVMYEDAMKEAYDLTLEKKILKI
ncbi:MAG: lipopolysaccharide biosynthesis protein [Candidatus Lokiarchaeota archaeon]|nr:lipopolysaccharide biosynthesis protein [Candidatus Lokiarchaeota archaeon]